jgi:hypothetical protein
VLSPSANGTVFNDEDNSSKRANVIFREGDSVATKMNVIEVVNLKSGKRVTVKGILSKEGEPVMELTSQFLFR